MSQFGVIYKIHDPNDVFLDNDGRIYEKCYIGKTKRTIEKRWNQHLRQSEQLNSPHDGRDGKLHAMLRAKGHEKFKVDVIWTAQDGHELAAKERELVQQFRCLEFGYNKVLPSGTYHEPEYGELKIENISIQFSNHSDLVSKLSESLQLNVSLSTLRKHLGDTEDDLDQAVTAAIASARETAIRSRKRIVFGIAFSGKRWLDDLAKDKRVNRLGLAKKTIEKRLRDQRNDFETEEQALEEILNQPSKRSGQVGPLKAPNDKMLGPWATYTAMRADLVELFPEHTFPKANNISGNVNDKKYSLEQAVGFENPPWRSTDEWIKADNLIDSGYRLLGEPKKGSPCVSHDYRRVFATQKEMAKAINYDPSDLGRLLRSKTPDEILKILGRSFV